MKICVIGLGSMGKRRIKHLKQMDSSFVITGIDRDAGRAASAAKQYEISCCCSLADVKERQDCAFVCTSPQLHGAVIQECLGKGMHVFSEINLIDELYDENMQLAKKKGKTLFLSSTPLYRAEIQFIDGRIKKDGGIFAYQYHVGQYLPDWHPWEKLDDFFVSSKRTNGCRELMAIELPWIWHVFGDIAHVNVRKRNLTELGLEFPDMYFIQIEHVNGNAGNLMLDVVSRQAVRRLEILNEHLYLRWDGTPDSLYEKDMKSKELIQIPAGEYFHEEGYEDFINEYAYKEEIKAFFEAIGGKEAIYSFQRDKEMLRIIDEIER